jgi:cytoskeleton protein RodZ
VTTAAERGSGDFGTMLKAAREQRGVSLKHISSTTKITVAALEALERNDISRLPGGIFSRAFVRSYALQVGLDPDATIEKFITQFPELAMTAAHAAAEQQEEEEQHDSNQQTAATFLRLIAISVPVVAGLLYLGTVSRRSAEPSRTPEPAPAAATAPQAPQAPQASTGAPAPSLGGQPATPEVPAASAGSSPAAPEPVRPAVPPPNRAASSPASSQAAAPDPSERVTVAVVATGPCWVSAIVDGERVVAREVQTGERLAFEFGRSVVLTAGDAAALAVTINGEEARPLGSAGQVVTVRVTPTNFKEYLATP